MTNFRDVLARLRAADLTHLAPRLVDQGVRNIDQMNSLTPEQVLTIAPDQRDLEAFCRLVGRSIPKRATEIRHRGRRDLPVATSATRGSIIGALEAATPAVQQEAIQNLVRDQYANATRNTRDSRWNLSTRLATSWKLPPLPITAELVQAIASSLKRGRYRSSAQIFSMAPQQHVAHTGFRLSADIEQQITMSIRSIERGLGPSTLKDAFIVEDLAAPQQTAPLHHRHQQTIGQSTSMTVSSSPSFAAGGCFGASKWQRPSSPMCGSRPPPSAGWRSSRSHVTKPTQSGLASHGRIHAHALTTWRPFVLTTPWTPSSDATIARAPTGMTSTSFMEDAAAPSHTWRR